MQLLAFALGCGAEGSSGVSGGGAGGASGSGALTQGGAPANLNGGDASISGAGLGGSLDAATSGSGGQPTNTAGSSPDDQAAEKAIVYVGSGFYDLAQPQLYVFELETETGTLTEVQKLSVDAFPSFLAVSPSRRHLYVNVENSPGSAIAYSIDAVSGKLTRLNDLANGGNGSAYISTDSTGKFVLQVNYESGSVVVLSTRADGGLGEVIDQHDLGGNEAYPHSVLVDPTDRFAFVTNRWNPSAPGNYIAQFRFNATTGTLSPNDPARIDLPFGTGPRHLAFHPNGKLVYVNNERNSTVSGYAYDATKGTLTKQQDISTLPANFNGKNAPADMRIHPSGKFLYVANRGQYSLALFSIDVTGALTALGHETFDGQPRNLFVDPHGRLLIVGDLGGSKVRVFRIDEQTGSLSGVGTPADIASPSGIAMMYLRGE